MKDPLTIDLTTAAELLGISRRTAYELARRDEFPVPVLVIGRLKKVSRRQLEAFIEGPGDQAVAS